MRNYKFIGLFLSAADIITGKSHSYTLKVYNLSVFEAFFCLTADAIRLGNHYQLSTITDEEGNIFQVDDILKISSLITIKKSL